MSVCENREVVIETLVKKGYDVDKLSEDSLLLCGLFQMNTQILYDVRAELIYIILASNNEKECYDWGLEHIRAELEDMNIKICKELDKIRGDMQK